MIGRDRKEIGVVFFFALFVFFVAVWSVSVRVSVVKCLVSTARVAFLCGHSMSEFEFCRVLRRVQLGARSFTIPSA